jgi:hypothetical protein
VLSIDFVVKSTRGREFLITHASSVVVSEGEANVAVRPAAMAPIIKVAKGRQLGSWMSTTGATSGPLHDAVGGRVSMALGSRPRD